MSRARSGFPLLLLVAIACLIGCSTDYRTDREMSGGYQAIALIPGPADAGPRDADGWVPAERMSFQLYKSRTIAGEQIRAPARLAGLRIREREVLPLVFSEVVVWRSDFAFARRREESTFTRYDLTTGATEVTPYERITEVPTPHTGRVFRYGWIKAGKGFAEDYTLHLPGPDGRPAGIIEHVFNVQPLGAGGHMIVHTNLAPNGSTVKHFRIYNDQGHALSPPLAIGHVQEWQRTYAGASFFSLRCDPQRNDLGWPVRPDGTILPMPPGLLGVRGLRVTDWIAWAAVWATPEGERIAWLNDPYDLDAIVSSRARAQFDGVGVMSRVVGYKLDYTLTAVVSMPGVTGWRAYDLPQWTEVSDRIYPSFALAESALKAASQSLQEAERARVRAEYADYLVRLEESRRVSAQRADAAREQQYAREVRERQQAAAAAASQSAAADAASWKAQFQYLTGQKW